MDSILNYFNGERIQCSIGVVISLIFISTSVYFLLQQKPFLNGMAYVAIPLSFFLIAICIAVIARTPNDIDRVTSTFKSSPGNVLTEELSRMERVMKNFATIKKVELGIFILGVVLIISFWNNNLVRGIALGLIIEGLILYLFDHIY